MRLLLLHTDEAIRSVMPDLLRDLASQSRSRSGITLRMASSVCKRSSRMAVVQGSEISLNGRVSGSGSRSGNPVVEGCDSSISWVAAAAPSPLLLHQGH